jgi:hypothetical protein
MTSVFGIELAFKLERKILFIRDSSDEKNKKHVPGSCGPAVTDGGEC